MKSTLIILAILLLSVPASGQTAHIRINQAGYLPEDKKIAIMLANTRIEGGFAVRDATTKATVYRGSIKSVPPPS